MAIQNARSNTAGNVPSALAQGQIAIQQADGILFTRTAGGGVRSTPLNPDALYEKIGYVAMGNANLSLGTGARTVLLTVTLTAARTLTLPSAVSLAAGEGILVLDVAGGVSGSNTLTIARSGSDTINGATSTVLSASLGSVFLISDGVSRWTAASGSILTAAAAADIRTGTNTSKFVTAGSLLDALAPVTIAYAATLTLDLTSAMDFDVGALTGALTLANPTTGMTLGRRGQVRLVQDATGGRTLAVGSYWKLLGGGSMDTAASAETLLSYWVYSATRIFYTLTKV